MAGRSEARQPPQPPQPPGRRTKIRLFVDQPLAAAGELALEGGAAHYLGGVMRLAPGDALRIFNGADGEWLARIAAIGRGRGRLQVARRLRAQQPEPGPSLLFAPLKKDAQDTLVQKASELGVSALQPVITRFTAVERINAERLRAQAIEAAEQCGRLSVPRILATRPLGDIVAGWPADVPLLLLDERGGRPIADALASLRHHQPDAAQPALLSGPEGGFAADEAADLAACPFVVRISLGPRILRAETAAIAALACWQAFAGDWRAAPGARPDQPDETHDNVGTE